ncbi:MAG: hypothetical protein GY839_09865, partial [candidate division Zixibacteria bacterium]|nr:hypothetical protein [candidate division Zixibacteria bacterium]
MKSMKPSEDSSREAKTRAEMEQIKSAIIGDESLVEGGFRSDYGYVGDIGSLPTNLDALVTDPGYSTWDGPYIISDFNENSEDYKRDAWNDLYTYTGDVLITSAGGGSTITKKFANVNTDITANTVTGYVYDGDGEAPGSNSSDISVIIYYPDGSGDSTSSTTSPDSSGNYSFSNSIPIGNHLVKAVYNTGNDTTLTYVSVPPASDANCQLRFSISFGGGVVADTIEIRVSHNDDDAEEDDGGGMTVDNDKIEMGQMKYVGLRF